MSGNTPNLEELRAFTHKQIEFHRRQGNTHQVDDLLDKLNNLEEMRAFIEQVATS